jgi:hypothetical protein
VGSLATFVPAIAPLEVRQKLAASFAKVFELELTEKNSM